MDFLQQGQHRPSEFGASFPQENLNSDKSIGFEIEGHKKVVSNDFDYSITGNFTWARSMVIQRGCTYGSSYSKWRNGAVPVENMRWGYGFVGQFQNQKKLTLPSNAMVMPHYFRRSL